MLKNAPLMPGGDGHCWNSFMRYTMKESSTNAIPVWMTTQGTWILVHDSAHSHDRWNPKAWWGGGGGGLSPFNKELTTRIHRIKFVQYQSSSRLFNTGIAPSNCYSNGYPVQTEKGKESVSISRKLYHKRNG